jgi:FG-GAP repeat
MKMTRTIAVLAVAVATTMTTGVAGPGSGAHAATAARPFDVNGDGYADLVVGVPGETLGSKVRAGALGVIHGSAAGPTAEGNEFWSQDSPGVAGGAEDYDGYGATVTSADFNRDGRADVAVGIRDEYLGTVWAGAVAVQYGSPTGLTATGNQFWSRDTAGVPGTSADSSDFGRALAAADFNRDGYADLAIGSPDAKVGTVAYAGSVTVLYGSSAGLRATGAQRWSQASTGIAGAAEYLDKFGDALAAGDLTGDGYADLAVGVPGENGSLGAIAILRGGTGGLSAGGNQLWASGHDGLLGSGGQFGQALAIGDLNRDGIGDLAAGAPAATIASCEDCGDHGAVNVIFGSSGGLTAAGNQYWHIGSPGIPGDPAAGLAFGNSLAVGDFDGDQDGDLAVSASRIGRPDPCCEGAVFLLDGAAGGPTAAGRVITEDSPGVPDTAGAWGGGDINLAAHRYAGGTRDWLAIGLPRAPLGDLDDAGQVLVVPGSPTGLDTSATRAWTQDSPGIRGGAEKDDDFGSVNGSPTYL